LSVDSADIPEALVIWSWVKYLGLREEKNKRNPKIVELSECAQLRGNRAAYYKPMSYELT